MPIVAIKKIPARYKNDPELYVNIISDGVSGDMVTLPYSPMEFPRDTLVPADRDVRLSRSGTLKWHGLDLSPVLKYRDTVHYLCDGETGDYDRKAYRVTILPEPGVYSLTKKGITRLAK